MPVIVIGADTPVGEAIVRMVSESAAEVRAFVSDDGSARRLKDKRVKVALGDISDASHVEAAALNCFCAVLIIEAATDGRERAFADPPTVLKDWAEAIRSAGVRRAIWVSSEDCELQMAASVPEVATVLATSDIEEVARRVADLEGVGVLPLDP